MTVEAAETFSEAEVLATGESIARAQEPSGAIAWPDGHVDAWDHVESAMALSACGLHGPARRAWPYSSRPRPWTIVSGSKRDSGHVWRVFSR